MDVRDELEVIGERRRQARAERAWLDERLAETVRRALGKGLAVEAIATHAGLNVAKVQRIADTASSRDHSCTPVS